MSNYNVQSNIDHYPGVSITYERRDILWSIHNSKIPFEGKLMLMSPTLSGYNYSYNCPRDIYFTFLITSERALSNDVLGVTVPYLFLCERHVNPIVV